MNGTSLFVFFLLLPFLSFSEGRWWGWGGFFFYRGVFFCSDNKKSLLFGRGDVGGTSYLFESSPPQHVVIIFLLCLELHDALDTLSTADHIGDMELFVDEGEGGIVWGDTLDGGLQAQEASMLWKDNGGNVFSPWQLFSFLWRSIFSFFRLLFLTSPWQC